MPLQQFSAFFNNNKTAQQSAEKKRITWITVADLATEFTEYLHLHNAAHCMRYDAAQIIYR